MFAEKYVCRVITATKRQLQQQKLFAEYIPDSEVPIHNLGLSFPVAVSTGKIVSLGSVPGLPLNPNKVIGYC